VKRPGPGSAARLTAVREGISDGALRLAYHAAVPVVIDAALLNLLRVNFFLDPPDAVPYETEAALLLSPLFREIGEDLYEIEPDVRNLLLAGLYSRYGTERVRRVALLLEQYTDATVAWRSQAELEQAQQLAALSFVDPARALSWLEDDRPGSSPQALGREWYVAMHRRVTEHSAVTTVREQINRAIAQFADEDAQTRAEAVHAMGVLSRLPEADLDLIVSALGELIHDQAGGNRTVTTPDVHAALDLFGKLPHGPAGLASITLIGADLSGLDFRGVSFRGSTLRGITARGTDFTEADFRGATITDSVMDGAHLDRADLLGATLARSSFRDATITDSNLDQARLQGGDFSGADLRGGSSLDTFKSATTHDEDLDPVQFRPGTGGEPGDSDPREVLARAHGLLDQGDLDEAQVAYQEVIDSGDSDMVALAATGLGLVHLRRGRLEEARLLLEQALRSSRETGDRGGEAEALTVLGQVDVAIGWVDGAVDHYREALEIYREVGDLHGEAETLTSIGLVSMDTSRLDEADQCFTSALMLFRQTGDRRGEGWVTLYLGNVHARLGSVDEAGYRLQSALGIFTDIDDRVGRGQALEGLAVLAIQAGVPDAEDHYAQAREIYHAIGATGDVTRLRQRMALAYQQTGDLDRAIELAGQNVSEAQRTLSPSDPGRLISETLLADLYLAAGRAEDALGLHQHVYATRSIILGQDDPATLASEASAAQDLRALGRAREARDLDEDVLTRRRRVLGENHSDTRRSAKALRADLRALGDGPESGQPYPSPRAYVQAAQAPSVAFTVPELQNARFVIDSLGLPAVAAGTSSVVLKAEASGRWLAVRCYTRGASFRERYGALAAYLAGRNLDPPLSAPSWIDSAIRVNGATWPVVLMDWIDGQPLDRYVDGLLREAGFPADALAGLAGRWRELIRTLQGAGFAHGGLSHADILVGQDGRLRLVDYDTAWIPALDGLGPPAGSGHRNYEPPGRRAWGRWVDTFPALVIYLSLVALAQDPGLWLELYDGSNLLFRKADFVPPFDTEVWHRLAALHDPEVDHLAQRLRDCCAPGWAATASLDETIGTERPSAPAAPLRAGMAFSEARLLRLTSERSDVELTLQRIAQAQTTVASKIASLNRTTQAAIWTRDAEPDVSRRIARANEVAAKLTTRKRRYEEMLVDLQAAMDEVQQVIAQNIRKTFRIQDGAGHRDDQAEAGPAESGAESGLIEDQIEQELSTLDAELDELLRIVAEI
jgi:uncharacterized protein YjbI with pentapeptide repeats